MNPEEFVLALDKSVRESNWVIYKDLFENTNPSDATDPYWKRALGLYGSLSTKDKEILLEIINQVMQDTISNVLGIVDGTSFLEGGTGQLSLRDGDRLLSGDLQDLYLLLQEERGT